MPVGHLKFLAKTPVVGAMEDGDGSMVVPPYSDRQQS